MDPDAQESTVGPTLTGIGFDVLASFNAILHTFPRGDSKGLEHAAVRNEYERFDLWAMNLGLYQAGHGALDYRLRDADAIRIFAERLLLELCGALKCGNVPICCRARLSSVLEKLRHC